MNEQQVVEAVPQLVVQEAFALYQPLAVVTPGVRAIAAGALSQNDQVQYQQLLVTLRPGVRTVSLYLRSPQARAVHDDHGHLMPDAHHAFCQFLGLAGANYRCAACGVIPPEERLQVVLMDQQRLNPVPGFMMFLDLVTLVSADFPGYIGVIIGERSTNHLFYEIVPPAASVAHAVIRILRELRRLTGRHPHAVCFTTRHSIRMDRPNDPLRSYFAEHNILHFPVAPQIRVPFVGQVLMADYFDRAIRILTARHRQRNWRAHLVHAATVFNRIVDADGLN